MIISLFINIVLSITRFIIQPMVIPITLTKQNYSQFTKFTTKQIKKFQIFFFLISQIQVFFSNILLDLKVFLLIIFINLSIFLFSSLLDQEIFHLSILYYFYHLYHFYMIRSIIFKNLIFFLTFLFISKRFFQLFHKLNIIIIKT